MVVGWLMVLVLPPLFPDARLSSLQIPESCECSMALPSHGSSLCSLLLLVALSFCYRDVKASLIQITYLQGVLM